MEPLGGGRGLELGPDEAQRLSGHVGPGVQHGHQVAALDDLDPGQLLRRRDVHGQQPRPVGGRTQETGVEGAGREEVRRVAGGARHLRSPVLAGRVLADQGELGDGLRFHVLEVPLDAPTLHQLAVGHVPGGIPRHGDQSLPHLQASHGDTELFGGQVDQDRPGLGRRAPQDRAELPDAQGAPGSAVPGTEVRVAHEHVHPLQGDIQFLRRQHGQGGHGALAHLDLAHEAAHPAVRADLQVGVEVLGITGPLGHLLGLLEGGQREADEEAHCPGGLEEVPAVDHQTPPFAAAASTAARIRTWAPQRQRLPSRASATRWRSGRGVFCSRATVLRIMPGVQNPHW